MFSLEGRTALVTGGMGILGRRFCAALADFGADVAVTDLDETGTANFARELGRTYGVRTLGVGCDVTLPESVAAMVEQVEDELGQIDILHNNAAGKTHDRAAFFAAIEDFRIETWRDVMAVNIDGMFIVAQAVGGRMAGRGSGSIIQTASIYGLVAPDQRIYEGSGYDGLAINTPAVYSASKAAVLGLTRHLAAYWAHCGVRVNAITPGGVESGQNETFQRRYSDRVPLGRMAQADEIAGALVFLASSASSYVTGQNIVVDGGLSVW